MKKLLVFSLGLLATSASAQGSKEPLNIECNSTADDSVGRQVCSSLRDRVALSPRYKLANNLSDSDKSYLWTVHITTVDITAGVNSAVGWTLTLTGPDQKGTGTIELFIINGTGVYGSSKASLAATTLMSEIDDRITQLKK
jgi:hypothetical protein